jgi:glycerol uptake facilitator-like aquaporin
MASWVAPIAVVLMNQIINNTERAGTAMTSSIIGFASYGLYAFGLVLGVYALTTVRKLGRKGVLIPAVIGILINGLLLAIFTNTFLSAVSGR